MHNAMSAKAVRVAARYGRDLTLSAADIYKKILEENYRSSAYNHPESLIVTSDPELQTGSWGLIPHTNIPAHHSPEAIEEAIHKAESTYYWNARSEKIFRTWPYRMVIEKQRCIVPSTGFFEYHHTFDKKSIPYFVYLDNTDIFSLAAVYDIWEHPVKGEKIKSFSLLTTDANPFMAKIHNGGDNPFRQLLILDKEEEEAWVDPEINREQIEKLIKIFPEVHMRAYPVDSNFRRKNERDSSILEEMPVTGELFD